MTISAENFVFLYGPMWNAPARLSKHHLAEYWAHRNRTLYVEWPPNPLSFITRPRSAWQQIVRVFRGAEEVAPNLHVWTCFYPLPYGGALTVTSASGINWFNQQVVLRSLRPALEKLQMSSPIFVIGRPEALPIIQGIKHKLVVYHCSDEHKAIPGFPTGFANLEQELLKETDVVIATSETLRDSKARVHPSVWAIPNGADYDHFSRTQLPETLMADDIRAIRHPIVGYIGSVFRWLDLDLIGYLSRQRPMWQFVFIGPVQVDVSDLASRPNVHFLGPRPYQTLPTYLKAFDVAIVPFIVDEVTLKASPIKFYEYLASGKPIVATRLPDFEPFAELVELTNDHDGFLAGLERAMTTDNPRAVRGRMAEARKHSWQTRFEQVDEILAGTLRDKGLG